MSSYSMTRPNVDWKKMNGLVPAVVQDSADGDVLMVGYMNPESLDRTLETGLVTFYSRSKGRLWTKGESSGHGLELVSLESDCDQDALLVRARPRGPTCHLGTKSCFGERPTQPPESKGAEAGFLEELEETIVQRQQERTAGSYTVQLLNEGSARCAQKVGEEGVEVALAAACGSQEELVEESADLLYHLLVALRSRDTSLSQVLRCLHQRHR